MELDNNSFDRKVYYYTTSENDIRPLGDAMMSIWFLESLTYTTRQVIQLATNYHPETKAYSSPCHP